MLALVYKFSKPTALKTNNQYVETVCNYIINVLPYVMSKEIVQFTKSCELSSQVKVAFFTSESSTIVWQLVLWLCWINTIDKHFKFFLSCYIIIIIIIIIICDKVCHELFGLDSNAYKGIIGRFICTYKVRSMWSRYFQPNKMKIYCRIVII